MQKTPTINLAKGRNISYVDRVINWALSVGRSIVILTEAVALAIFLMRFSYDKQIIDLHTTIKQEQGIVNAYASQEALFRKTQTTLTSIGKLDNQATQLYTFIHDIISTIPQGMSLSDVSITQNVLHIHASFLSSSSLATFIKTLQGNSAVASVGIDKIDNKPISAVIIAEITATLKK